MVYFKENTKIKVDTLLVSRLPINLNVIHMKSKLKITAIIRILFIAVSFFCINAYAQTAVKSWGQLRVDGPNIVNEDGAVVQLQGMSLFWSQWYPQFYEYNTIKWLRDDWCINIIRPAIGIRDDGNYYEGENNSLARARAVIDAAIELDIYVLVDWHAHYAPRNIESAKKFFRTIAQEYGNHPNIIYEIFNEPIGYSWGEIKSYSEQIITEIRKYDPDNIIVCGTPQWSAFPDAVIGNAINQSNIAYTLHYYAASHFQDYRNRANAARGNGLCVFVTEYGLVNADGNGAVNEGSSRDWWNWMNDNKISHCNWSLCDKDEGASALQPGTQPGGFWNDNQLSWSGSLVRANLKANCPYYEPKTPITTLIPGKVEAEHYAKMSGVQRETTTDLGGGQNIGFIGTGDWMEYLINATGSGNYTFNYRVASPTGSAFKLYLDGKEAHEVIVPTTGDWQKWVSIEKTLSLSAGTHTLKVVATAPDWNINYIDITSNVLVDCNGDVNGSATIDDCDVCSGGSTGITVNACEGNCTSGYSSVGVKDDFTLENDPYNDNGGVYSWGEIDLEGDDNPAFQALITRNSTTKSLEAIITQAEAQYIPFGFSFGEQTSPTTIDLNDDATFEFIFTNPSSTDLNVALSIQDIDGNLINTYSTAAGQPFADAWKYGVIAKVNAGATFTFKGDLSNGYYANYETKKYDEGFDYSKVATVLLTVTNQKNTGAPNFAPLALSNVTIHVEEFRIGDCSNASNDNGLTTGTEKEINKNQLYLYPNPASNRLTLSEESSWTLTSPLGRMIKKGNGNFIDIQNLPFGVYFIQTPEETLRFVKQ